MIIACPACKTRYMVPADKLSRGRVVRCSRCANEWFQHAPSSAQKAAESEAQQPPPPRQEDVAYSPKNLPAVSSAAQKAKRSLIASALIALAVLLSVGSGLYLGRDVVINALPWTQGMYAAAGLTSSNGDDEVIAKGLAMPPESLNKERREDEFSTLILSGDIVNETSTAKEVPDVYVALLDETGDEIDGWRVQPEKRLLEAGEKTTWTCYFVNLPEDRPIASVWPKFVPSQP